jgi:hypothetical protein
MDNDFPAPAAQDTLAIQNTAAAQDVQAAQDGEYLTAKASAAYVQSAEFRDTVFQMVFDEAFKKLNGLTIPTIPTKNDSVLRSSAVAWACYDWLHVNSAGAPYLPMVDGNAREDARFWAETAQPQELECYALAAMDKLRAHNAPFVSRQIKRLVAALWRRMAPSEQKAFVEWLVKDLSGSQGAQGAQGAQGDKDAA